MHQALQLNSAPFRLYLIWGLLTDDGELVEAEVVLQALEQALRM